MPGYQGPQGQLQQMWLGNMPRPGMYPNPMRGAMMDFISRLPQQSQQFAGLAPMGGRTTAAPMMNQVSMPQVSQAFAALMPRGGKFR